MLAPEQGTPQITIFTTVANFVFLKKRQESLLVFDEVSMLTKHVWCEKPCRILGLVRNFCRLAPRW